MVRVDGRPLRSCLSSAFRSLRSMHTAGKRKPVLSSNHSPLLPVRGLDLHSTKPVIRGLESAQLVGPGAGEDHEN